MRTDNLIAAALLLSGLCAGAARAQEPAAWPGYRIDYGYWAQCHYPWTKPELTAASCVAPTGGFPAGPLSFLAQIIVDRPAEDFDPQFREGKTLFEMQHVCGGALVAPDWVLTAGHCISKDQIALGYKVRLGVDRISDLDEGLVFDIAEVVPHPKFNSFEHDDLALVRIVPKPRAVVDNPGGLTGFADPGRDQAAPPFYLSFVNIARPSNMPSSRAPWGFETVTAYGWGKSVDVEGDAPSSATLGVRLKVLPNALCARLDGYGPEKVTANVFCAADPLAKTCRGDSGGPVLDVDGNMIGVVSWGKNRCTDDGLPGVYTRVAAYIDWIDAVIGESLRTRAENSIGTAPARPQ